MCGDGQRDLEFDVGSELLLLPNILHFRMVVSGRGFSVLAENFARI